MLSRVAERLYWAARYAERAESTARMVSVYSNLMLDLPRDADFSWYNLIVLNSAEEEFGERYTVQDERNVIKFLLADDTNPNSMLNCLRYIRENFRTTRDVVPGTAWEMINDQYHFASDSVSEGINRSNRHDFLARMIQSFYQFYGLFSASMYRDEGWDFWRMGYALETADMTSRIVDAGARIADEAESDSAETSQLVWGHVLRSLDAYYAYRRTTGIEVSAEDAARYLVEDMRCPKAIAYSLLHLVAAVEGLPGNARFVAMAGQLGSEAATAHRRGIFRRDLSEYLNRVQIRLGDLHGEIADTWFA